MAIGFKIRERLRDRDTEGGFTLVELLVVLVILSLVMGLVGPRVLSYLTDARVRSAKLQIDSLAASLDLFYLDTGRYPSEQEGLKALIARSPSLDNWNGPYLQQSELPLDPWGKPYEYRVPGEKKSYDIVSLGSDGRQGGTDDAADLVNR
ncbi:MAG: type II secretion system major pseudopilin GspG [Rhizobiales bacterium]|nr:type II secretion system major pseudopilin GspG [Hyphomicrobiales bacterium]MDQ3557740.1 type II secretion system major pseudopilin GspG [Pseudomonadota bacterium]